MPRYLPGIRAFRLAVAEVNGLSDDPVLVGEPDLARVFYRQ
jgi:hypothetical protein